MERPPRCACAAQLTHSASNADDTRPMPRGRSARAWAMAPRWSPGACCSRSTRAAQPALAVRRSHAWPAPFARHLGRRWGRSRMLLLLAPGKSVPRAALLLPPAGSVCAREVGPRLPSGLAEAPETRGRQVLPAAARAASWVHQVLATREPPTPAAALRAAPVTAQIHVPTADDPPHLAGAEATTGQGTLAAAVTTVAAATGQEMVARTVAAGMATAATRAAATMGGRTAAQMEVAAKGAAAARAGTVATPALSAHESKRASRPTRLRHPANPRCGRSRAPSPSRGREPAAPLPPAARLARVSVASSRAHPPLAPAWGGHAVAREEIGSGLPPAGRARSLARPSAPSARHLARLQRPAPVTGAPGARLQRSAPWASRRAGMKVAAHRSGRPRARRGRTPRAASPCESATPERSAPG